MHSVTYCLCWFKDKLRAFNCCFLYSADAFFFYSCRPFFGSCIMDDCASHPTRVHIVSNGCTDYMYIKYICITFTPCILDVSLFLFFLVKYSHFRVWATALTSCNLSSLHSELQNLSTNKASEQISLSVLSLKDNSRRSCRYINKLLPSKIIQDPKRQSVFLIIYTSQNS